MSGLVVRPHRGGRFVAFADILGFKGLVKANTLIKVTQLIRHVVHDGCVRGGAPWCEAGGRGKS
jgi:hypothetical protein